MKFTLLDGRQVDGSSEDWRHHCEGVAVLKMPTGAREGYLQIVGKKRGEHEMRRLRNTIQLLWTDKTAREILALERTDLLAAEQRLERIGRNDALGERLRAGVEARMKQIQSMEEVAA